jgi:hypothetical protein
MIDNAVAAHQNVSSRGRLCQGAAMSNAIPPYGSKMGRIFQLTASKHYISAKRIEFPHAIILTPELVAEEMLVIAWTYALRYSAKGFDYPDYDAAISMLLARHPTWELIDRHAHIINPDLTQDIDDLQ